MTTVVSDTSPIHYLVLIDAIEVLPELFDEILIPPAVLSELLHAGTPKPVYDWAAVLPEWVKVARPALVDSSIGLGAGETEAISLAVERSIPAILMDEKKGRLAARARGIVPVGTLAILEAAHVKNLLDFELAIAKLQTTRFRVSSTLVNTLIQEVRLKKRNP